MTLDLDDAQHLLAEVARFAHQRVSVATARPELPMAPATLESLTREATELGLLPRCGAEPGVGLWEHLHSAPAQALNTGILRRVACANAGVAFAWHRMALACAVARELGCEHSAPSGLGLTLLSTGHYGLARTSLARWFKRSHAPSPNDADADADADAEDDALLADWLDRSTHDSVLVAPAAWQAVLWPVWQNGGVGWHLCERDQLQLYACPAPHGLDEVAGFTVRAQSDTAATAAASATSQAPIPTSRTWDAESSRQLYQRVLKLDMLGLLAIGHGALLHGQTLARAYAGVRKQGGKTIGQHPAVQQLLAEIEMAGQQAEVALAAFAVPVDTIDLGRLCATRISAHQALCHAANQVVQVHGGSGYMRDTGAEKIVRDQNMLKLQIGGTRDAHLFVAAWMEDSV